MIVHSIFHQLAACETKNLGAFETYHDMEMIPLIDLRIRFVSINRFGSTTNYCIGIFVLKILPTKSCPRSAMPTLTVAYVLPLIRLPNASKVATLVIQVRGAQDGI